MKFTYSVVLNSKHLPLDYLSESTPFVYFTEQIYYVAINLEVRRRERINCRDVLYTVEKEM